MLKFTDYYRAKTSLKTTMGIIPQGSIGHMSQYQDVIRFEGISNNGEPNVITAIANKVRESENLFEAIDFDDTVEGMEKK